MKDYILPEWQALLTANQLGSFEQLWNVDAELVEPINKRRGGWSGVSRLYLKDAQDQTVVLYLKRQQNHGYRSVMNLFKSATTFRREMKNMHRFMRYGIPIAEPIYYAERKVNKQNCAILITASISPEYLPLESLYAEWQQNGFPPIQDRREVIKQVAYATRQIHRRFIRHGSLLTKHVFVKYVPGEPVKVRFIDLEKARYWFLPRGGSDNDLNALRRNIDDLRLSEKMLFYKHYKGVQKIKDKSLGLLKTLVRRANKPKGKKKS